MSSLSSVIASLNQPGPRSLAIIRGMLEKLRLQTEPNLSEMTQLVSAMEGFLSGEHRQALDAIGRFGTLQTPLAFRDFHRRLIAFQMIQRLLSPEIIDQRRTEFCGPTAFMINLCRQKPFAWAQLTISLAETGKARIGDLELKPGSGVRDRNPSNICQTAEADWIIIASLRDSVSWDLMHVANTMCFKSFEDVGVSWENIEDWNKALGFTSVVTLGSFNEDRWIENFHVRAGALWPRLLLSHKVALNLADDRTRQLRMLEFAAQACEQNWAVFFLVDDKLGRAIQGTEIADAAWLNDRREARGQSETTANPAITKSLYQSAATTLNGADVGGHVFLLLSLELGGTYVSLVAINRGNMVSPQLLPKAAFIASVRGIIASTDAA
jgi:hypothetical protein